MRIIPNNGRLFVLMTETSEWLVRISGKGVDSWVVDVHSHGLSVDRLIHKDIIGIKESFNNEIVVSLGVFFTNNKFEMNVLLFTEFSQDRGI